MAWYPPSTTISAPGMNPPAASPANNNVPKIVGSTPTGTTVALYANGTCGDTAIVTGASEATLGMGVTVTVADDTTTMFSARAQDAAGNVSACSTVTVT